VANVVYSARRVFEGFVIAAGVGIPLGLFIGWNRLVARIVDPSVSAPPARTDHGVAAVLDRGVRHLRRPARSS